MLKFFFKTILVIFIITISILIFFTYFGFETNRFDSIIKNRTNEINRNASLEFSKIKIYFDPVDFSFLVKLKNPKILIKNDEIYLSKLNLFLSIKSFFGSDFLLKKAKVAFVDNDIKDLTKITNIFLPKILNKKLKKIFKKGTLKGEFFIPFEKDGKVAKDYGFTGKISDASIILNKELSIKNLTTDINHGKEVENGGFKAIIKKGSFFNLDLSDSTIYLKNEGNRTKVKATLHTDGKINFNQVKKISSLLGFKTDSYLNINGNADLKTKINFIFDNKFKIHNPNYSIEGKINFLELHTKEKKIIRKYLPLYDPKIIFKDTTIKLVKLKSEQNLDLNGLIKLNKKLDKFKIIKKYNLNKKSFDISGMFDLTNSELSISKINYVKNDGKKAELNFNLNFILDKYYIIRELKFLSGKDKIFLSKIRMNKNFKTDNLKKLEIKTFLNEIKNNDFSINKSEKITISGEVFDAQPLLKSLYKKSDDNILGKNFKSEVKVDFDKTLTGTGDNVSNFSMIAEINKGSFDKLNLKGNYSKNEIIEMSIYKTGENNKTLQIISDRARPFIKHFAFIKGFEGGKLEYESFITKEKTNSNLKIINFKVSKVPALAKLLTLASLQGIADTLSGEGINFEIFEMKSVTKNNILNIEEAYASGPAVSILLDGYIDKGNLVSLRGTLVPARWLNSIINKIPIIGEILVGEKTGEGVVGVSFKMKGPPKDIKTIVNPIKTLTPRFIIRALDKIKKEQQN